MPSFNQCCSQVPEPPRSGQAVVTLSGQDYYLGPYGSIASQIEYDRLIGEWLAGGRQIGRR